MVLLSDDLFWIASEKIRDVRVLKMFVGGRVVFYVTAAEGRYGSYWSSRRRSGSNLNWHARICPAMSAWQINSKPCAISQQSRKKAEDSVHGDL
jgi:hypothetical protein